MFSNNDNTQKCTMSLINKNARKFKWKLQTEQKREDLSDVCNYRISGNTAFNGAINSELGEGPELKLRKWQR